MKEKLIHMEAFEYYFVLGKLAPIKRKKDLTEKFGIKRGSKTYDIACSVSGKRSLQKVAREFNVSRTAVYNWHKAFNWEERVRKRDQEINRKVEERLAKKYT
jgi:cyclopropane fatty-acyl-phospholipid synthase-like methyltransferase